MPMTVKILFIDYLAEIHKIYGLYLKSVIFYGAYEKACYSLFYTISAVYAKESVVFKNHKDTLRYFNINYISTEIFSRELRRKTEKTEEIWHVSNYNTFYISSREVTEQ